MKSQLKSVAKTAGTVILVILFCYYFVLNNPGSWGNYEGCLQIHEGMSGAEVIEIMGEPDSDHVPDHGRYDLVYVYDRYAWNSSGPILVNLDVEEVAVVVGKTCEDIW